MFSLYITILYCILLEEDTVTFKVKKDKETKSKKHKMRKRIEIDEIKMEEDVVVMDEIKPDPTLIPDEESDRHFNLGKGSYDLKAKYGSDTKYKSGISQPEFDDDIIYDGEVETKPSNDTKSKFGLGEIPDDKMIYEARKKRQAMRQGGGEVQPAIQLEDPMHFDKHSKSRFIREDDHDVSDEEVDTKYISSKSLIVNEEEKRRNEQLEALRLEQGSDEENEKESEDEELVRWEKEQIMKAVSKKKVRYCDFL